MRPITTIALLLIGGGVFALASNSTSWGWNTYLLLNTRSQFSTSPSECEDGASEQYPMEGSKCSATDSGQSRPYLGSCTRYLECADCIWRVADCPEGTYYTAAFQDCVSPESADCAAGLFGLEAKIWIESAGEALVMTDCQECFSSNNPFPTSSLVMGFSRLPDSPWNQVLVAARRANSDYYSFAFDRSQGGEFKVITDNCDCDIEPGRGLVIWSIVFKGDPTPENKVWRVVPTTDSAQSEKYRIVSIANRGALAVTLTDRDLVSGEGATYRALEMDEFDENDESQFWKFRPVSA